MSVSFRNIFPAFFSTTTTPCVPERSPVFWSGVTVTNYGPLLEMEFGHYFLWLLEDLVLHYYFLFNPFGAECEFCSVILSDEKTVTLKNLFTSNDFVNKSLSTLSVPLRFATITFRIYYFCTVSQWIGIFCSKG